jgi:beta-glucosidase
MKFLSYEWKHRATRAWLVTTCVLLVIVIAVTAVLSIVPIAANSLSLLFGGERANIVEDHRDEFYDRQFGSKEDVLAAAQDLVVEIEEEGITLLKNDGGEIGRAHV